jgi:hypothetical protein
MTVRPINDGEVASFHKNGWVHLPGLVDKDTVAHVLELAEKAFAENRSSGEFGEIVDRNFAAFRGENRQGRVGREMVMSPVMGRNVARLLDLPALRVLADGYLLKGPQKDGAHDGTLFHQDFPGNPVDRSAFLTIWVALHDMPAEMGVMRFYNGSHRLGVFGQVFADGIDLRARCRALKEEDLSPPLDLKAGDATAHHSLTVHGAPPNLGHDKRWAYNILYMEASTRYTASPGLFPEGLVVEPMAVLDQPQFPLVPMA